MLPYQTINGELKPSGQASIQINDLGLLRGYGIFDYFLLVAGKAVFMMEHIDRFYRSAAQLYMEVPFTKMELAQQVEELVQANEIPNAGIRLVLTGGYADNGYMPSGNCNCLVIQHPFSLPEPALFERGIHLMLHEYQRDLPEVKSTNYLVPVYLQRQLREARADDVLYHFDHFVSETSRANVFIITDSGTLVTSTGNVLQGITRNKVLPLARDRMPVEERLFTLEELSAAREIFITSTTKGILAVTQIDQKPIGDGNPGPLTLSLAEALSTHVRDHMGAGKVLV